MTLDDLYEAAKEGFSMLLGLALIAALVIAGFVLLMFWFELQGIKREYRLLTFAITWGIGIGLPLILVRWSKTKSVENDLNEEPLPIGSDGYPYIPKLPDAPLIARIAVWAVLGLWLVCCILMIQDIWAFLSELQSSCAPDDYPCEHPGRF